MNVIDETRKIYWQCERALERRTPAWRQLRLRCVPSTEGGGKLSLEVWNGEEWLHEIHGRTPRDAMAALRATCLKIIREEPGFSDALRARMDQRLREFRILGIDPLKLGSIPVFGPIDPTLYPPECRLDPVALPDSEPRPTADS